jgi:hypothetical protein
MLLLLSALTVLMGALGCVVAAAMTVHRVVVRMSERRRAAAERRMRPVAFAVLDGGQPPARAALADRDLEALAGLLARYGRTLDGDARARIGTFFRVAGLVDREARAVARGRRWRRVLAAHTLGDTACRDAVLPLCHALAHDPERSVRTAAAISLGRLGAVEAVGDLAFALTYARVPEVAAGQALALLGTAAVPSLRFLTRHDDAALRATACELLGWVGGPTDQDALLPCLRDPAAEVRARAARALGRIGAGQAAHELEVALRDRIPFVRTAAAHALATLGTPTAIFSLVRQAQRDSFWPATAAARALERIAPDVVAELAARGGAGIHIGESADRLALTAAARGRRAA